MAIEANIVQVTDSAIERNRIGRITLFVLSPIVLGTLGALITGTLAEIFLGGTAFFAIGLVIGAVLGFVVFLSIKHLFVVQNNSISLLVTLDPLQSLLGRKNVNVVYGPGTHLCFPWEERFAENSIPVKEVAAEFTLTAICKDGVLTVTGSFRLRPDFKNPIAYLSGVGSAADDFKALLIAFISDRLTRQTMQEALNKMKELNDALYENFVKGDTAFEHRFGVQAGDVTVSNMLFSNEAQRTRTALNQATVVSQGTALLLGFETVEEMMAALGSKITRADIDRARREFRIISGNTDGEEVKYYEVEINGLTPEASSSLSSIFSNPAAGDLLAGVRGRKELPKKEPKV